MFRNSDQFDRRVFLRTTGAAAVTAAMRGSVLHAQEKAALVPSYLKGYESLYAQDPRAAARKWFAESKYGLFMHYGLYSLLGRGEWVMFHEQIPVAQYEKFHGQFTAARFDADFITDMALDAQMKYVNITSRHHEGFCLFDTKTTDYNSVRSPARRDLIAELAEQCRNKGLGLFLYYSYGMDWRHPYFFPNTLARIARPAYQEAQPAYKYRKPEDFRRYIDYAHQQLRELLTNYGPLAGIWFDPIMTYYAQPQMFPIEETYALVRSLQPHVLISFKQGTNGSEDFAAPERAGASLADRVRKQGLSEKSVQLAAKAWEINQHKHNEICDTMQPGIWGYQKADEGRHATPDDVMRKLAAAKRQNCNLLLNTGPLPDGSIHAGDAATLGEVGRRIGRDGWPDPAQWPEIESPKRKKPRKNAPAAE